MLRRPGLINSNLNASPFDNFDPNGNGAKAQALKPLLQNRATVLSSFQAPQQDFSIAGADPAALQQYTGRSAGAGLVTQRRAQRREQELAGRFGFLNNEQELGQDRADDMLLDALASDERLQKVFKPRYDEARERLLSKLQAETARPYTPPEMQNEEILERRYGDRQQWRPGQ